MPMFGLADVNSFYASCEALFRPDLRGKRIRFSITRHPPTPDTPLLRRRADSRVIYGPVWLKFIRARQNLLQEDLLTPIHFLTDHAVSDVAYSECGGLYRTPGKKH
ncbi:hypothetical protein [Candidatus Pantoea formicae]|uniref:hypothetical protein n=1 Tax=Candidatus Pantoea formicae TaxID=2608355 RepID=UPI001966A72A|nr:hypothetical protein [Pantoea formicae]